MHRPLLGLGLIVLLAYALTGVYQVKSGERLVVRRLGRVLEYKPGPGLWVGLPWGIDRVDRIGVDTSRSVTVGYQPMNEDETQGTVAGQLLTGDHNLVNVQITLEYSVEPDQVADFALEKDKVDALVGRSAEAVLLRWAAGRSIDEVLLVSKAQLARQLASETQAHLRESKYRLGVLIHHATVGLLIPPESVKEAFDEVTRAETEIQTRRNEANQEAHRGLQEAQAEKFRLEQSVGPFVRYQREQAEAEVVSFERALRLGLNQPAQREAEFWSRLEKLAGKLRDSGQTMQLPSAEGAEFIVPGQLRPRKR